MLTLAEIALPFEERGEAETQALADDLYRQLSRGANFGAVASEYSRSGSAERGGVLERGAGQPPAGGLPHPGPSAEPRPGDPSDPDLRRPRPRQARLDQAGRCCRPIPEAELPAAREELRQQLFTERIGSFGQGYLQELLGDALIVER